MVCNDDSELVWIFGNTFSIWPSCVGRKATERWNPLSGVHTVKPLFKTQGRLIVSSIYLWWSLMYCWRQKSNCHLRQLWLPGSHTVKTPRVNIWDAQRHMQTRTHTLIYTCHSPLCLCLFFFPALSVVLHEWQSYFLHCLAYCSIKPLIGLDSFYLSPVEYGSL